MAQKPPRSDWMRDDIWQFIGVVVGTISLIVAIIFGLLALPQSAPIRASIEQVVKGTPAVSATSAPTIEPTTIPNSPPTATPSGPQLLYKADFAKDRGAWQAGGFTLSGNTLICSTGNCSFGPSYIPPTADYKVVVEVQFLGESRGYYVNGRINDQFPAGKTIGYDGQDIYTSGNSGEVCFAGQNVNPQFSFTESVTYTNGTANLNLSQSGLNIPCSLSTSDGLPGKASLVSNGALKLISFEIYSLEG